MIAGGLFALWIPISYLLLNRDDMRWTAYYSLVAGVVAISRGASGETSRLGRIVGLQAANVIAFDLLNLVLAGVEQWLLRRPPVKQYLHAANGGGP